MSDVPLWLSILLYAVAAIAIAGVLYLLMITAMRAALREPLAELRTARRRQEDLLRDLATSASYLADVADVWAEAEAERRGVPAEATGAVDAAEPVVDPHPFARPVDPVDLPEDELEERPEAGDNDAPEQATRVR